MKSEQPSAPLALARWTTDTPGIMATGAGMHSLLPFARRALAIAPPGPGLS